ncbi:MAG TPA: hypothetical protein VGO80_14490 [Solirubrobacteraceae bacterium]|jgi:hypothetical protein|nr:hypothetical protein [Solirubrobacteraceae bacterium]
MGAPDVRRAPEQYRRAEHYDHGVREVARYRVEQHIADDTLELGPEPDGGQQRTWRQAQRVAEQTQRRLGRDVDRGRDREADLGIDR